MPKGITNITNNVNTAILGLLLFGLTLLPARMQAGHSRDSLQAVLSNLKDGSERVDVLLLLAQSYMLESAAEVRKYALDALKLSDSLNYPAGRVKALSNLTWAARSSGDYSLALDYASKCLNAASKINDVAGQANARYEMAAIYQAQKNYTDARAMFHAARPLYESAQDTYGIGKSYNGVGESYRWEQKWDSALSYYSQADFYFRAINHAKGIILLKNNRGLVYLGRGQYDVALDTLMAANAAARAENFISVVLESSIEIAKAWIHLSDLNEAKKQAEQALYVADSLDLKKYINEAAEVLYDIAYQEEDFKKALEYQKLAYETAAILRSEEVSSRLSNLDVEMQMRGKEAEIESLQKDKRIRSLWQTLLGVLLALAFVIFLLMAHAYRRNRRSTRLLAFQNEQLGELNREKDSLMNIVAHDLKSPLSKVKALSAMAGMAGPLTERQQTALSMIEKVVTDGERLIQDLLDISRAEANNTALKLETVEANALIREWMGQHRENASRKRIELSFETSQPEIGIYTENSYLARIFDNLLSNAIKYTPTERKVHVKSWVVQDRFFVSVKDQGPGISKEDQEKMFRKFQRLSARPTGGESSTGLGLSIIKTLIERLKGDISLESSMGDGSTFIVSLPLQTPKS